MHMYNSYMYIYVYIHEYSYWASVGQYTSILSSYGIDVAPVLI